MTSAWAHWTLSINQDMTSDPEDMEKEAMGGMEDNAASRLLDAETSAVPEGIAPGGSSQRFFNKWGGSLEC